MAKTTKATRASRYKPHPTFAREAKFAAKLLAETGKTLDAWVVLARKKKFAKASECRAWLEKEHGVTGHQAMWVASYAVTDLDPGQYDDPAKLVDALYSGSKAALLPLHDAVVDLANTLGDDVIATACKTMVPIYRKHVFAELKPGAGGVEVQMALGDVPAAGRLRKIDARMADDRLTHVVTVASPKDIDAELKGWLADAYARGAAPIKRATSAATPDDLSAALSKSKKAAATWATCTPAMQRDMIVWITSAKQADTRSRRLGTAVAKLAEGKRRVY